MDHIKGLTVNQTQTRKLPSDHVLLLSTGCSLPASFCCKEDASGGRGFRRPAQITFIVFHLPSR